MMKRDYGAVTLGQIFATSITHDNKYVFVADSKGFIKQISINLVEHSTHILTVVQFFFLFINAT